MTAQAFGFTKLVVQNLDPVVRFYCEVFGLQEQRRVGTDQHRYALDEAVLTLPGAAPHALIITRYRQLQAPAAGAAWTGFVVDDLDATLALVTRLGGKVEVEPHRNPEYAVIAAIAADPEGHLIEILQMLAAQPA